PLDQGIRKVDESRFAPDTVYHPRQPARILTTRQNRIYGTTNGEVWAVEPVGNRLEVALVYRHAQPNPDANDVHRGRVLLEVLPTPAALRIGLLPNTVFSCKNLTRNGPASWTPPAPNPPDPVEPQATYVTAVTSLFREPFELRDGDVFRFQAA